MKNRAKCLFCDCKDIKKIIDLGIQPLADTFVAAHDTYQGDFEYPLQCMQCSMCGGIQTAHVVPPGERYCMADYSYTSSNSKFSRKYWEAYAAAAIDLHKLSKDDLVIEIGSNDGYLLEQFKKVGARVLGVDPSMYVNDLARKRGVRTLTAFFNELSANYIKDTYGQPRLIIANNVFNHTNDPMSFMKGVVSLMDDNTSFVCESPYWLESIKSKRFDQIYHEHVFYFTAVTMKHIARTFNLKIIDIKLKDYHGGSLSCTFNKQGDESPDLEKFIASEKAAGLYEPQTYSNFMCHINEQKNLFVEEIKSLKEQGHTIIAVGAAAKGNTLLNFYGLDSTIITWVTDASAHKQGKFTPRTRIPICGDDVFKDLKDPYAIILSWNISSVLKKILHRINPNIHFIDLPE